MDTNRFDDIVARLADNMRKRVGDKGESPGSRRVSEYTDPDRYRREVQGLFRELPIVVAHSSQLAEPGAFVAHDWLGAPIIVTRTETGEIAAFHNVCPHRSTLIETAPCGVRTGFTCRYHAWSFELDGKVRNIPDAASFDGIDRDRLGLRRIETAERHGLVFVRLADGPPIDIDAYLGALGPELEAFGLADHNFFSERLTPLDCNWKVMSEGSLETYHFSGAHPTSIAPHFASMAGLQDSYGPHQRFVLPNRKLLQALDRGEDPRPHYLVNIFIFPNTYVTFPHDHMTLTQVFPRAVGKCLFHNALLVRGEGLTEKQRAYWEKALDLTEGVNDEDFAIIQSIQKTYDTSPAEFVFHGRYEQGLSHFHAACDEIVSPARA